jgi:hypothetical protein
LFNNTTYAVANLGNTVNVATTVIVPSNTTDHFYLLNTAASDTINNYNVQLPAATTAGQVIAVLTTNPFTAAAVDYLPSGSDQILGGSSVTAANAVGGGSPPFDPEGTSFESISNWAQFISDGNHHWYLLSEDE